MECVASEVKLFGECLLRLNHCVYCVVDPESRDLIYTFTETQEPLHVSDEWVVFRSQICSLRKAHRQIQIQSQYYTKARVLDVNDSTVLYSDGTAVQFVVAEGKGQRQRQGSVDVTEFSMLTPTGFAAQDRNHTKIRRLDEDRTIVLINTVPSHLRSSRYILNHHGDAHVVVSSPSDSKQKDEEEEHWVVDAKGRKFRLPHTPVKIHRHFIRLNVPNTVFQRHARTGEWDKAVCEFDTPTMRSWVSWTAASQIMVRVEDYVGRNASAWVLMNTGIKLVNT